MMDRVLGKPSNSMSTLAGIAGTEQSKFSGTRPLLPQLREDQIEFWSHPAQTKVVSNGRRWGNVYDGVYSLTCADYGAAVAWVVPTSQNSRPVWRFAESQVVRAQGVDIHKIRPHHFIPSGGWLGVYSADNDVGLRGESFDVVIIDEAAQVAEDTYSDVILPTLADRDGRLLMISTPKVATGFIASGCAGPVMAGRWPHLPRRPQTTPTPTSNAAAALARARLRAHISPRVAC